MSLDVTKIHECDTTELDAPPYDELITHLTKLLERVKEAKAQDQPITVAVAYAHADDDEAVYSGRWRYECKIPSISLVDVIMSTRVLDIQHPGDAAKAALLASMEVEDEPR